MSAGSETSGSEVSVSKVHQFGLYRSIDAKTEEFLKLSKKRQIKQGCVCAAVSTAITVTVVVIILLIYEYAIAVEKSLVQNQMMGKNSNNTNITNDIPIAERLDRTYFGFDQDYYERMPLLVNAMQENSYMDLTETPVVYKQERKIKNDKHVFPTTIGYRPTQIRRTSPRPFIFEYKNPSPQPFSNSYSSRSWVDSYRNAQRLRNLQQVINYLEKTINAKFGDIYSMPTAHIAFSGVYLHPNKDGNQVTRPSFDQAPESSNTVHNIRSNHHRPDPLFKFKPESPGDVNLLAENLLRFSPTATSILKSKFNSKIPMFRPISNRKRNCLGTNNCENSNERHILNLLSSGEMKSTESSETSPKPTTFSVMLNLIPLTPTEIPDLSNNDLTRTSTVSPDDVYFTTSKPIIQFRRKSSSVRRNLVRRKKPRIVIKKRKISRGLDLNESRSGELREALDKSESTKMIVHVNLFPKIDNVNIDTEVADAKIETENPKVPTEITIVNATQVEDYHVGSSGIIPIEQVTEPTVPILPQVTTMIPFFDTTTSNTINTWSTNSPEILKFSHEDAKVPDHYRNMNRHQNEENYNHFRNEHSTEFGRRNSRDNFEIQDETGSEEMSDEESEAETLIVKLKNYETTTLRDTIEPTTIKPEVTETSTTGTYVPQINGHYRSINQKPRAAKDLLESSEEMDRKKRLELSVGGIRKPTYVPIYTEIKRNKTNNTQEKRSSD